MIINSENIGVQVPEILLPKKDSVFSKWSVVACDQYTSQPSYWSQVESIVGNSPSTLYLTFPEIYLEKEDGTARIEKINSTMKDYLNNNVLVSQNKGFVLVDRQTPFTKSRKGLILSVDLDKYDYNQGSQTLIRATEGTVVDRLPPRIKIRENASIELPHIMLLIDDPYETVIKPLSDKRDCFEKLYDFDLMMNGGHICGYKVDSEEDINNVITSLVKLADPDIFYSKYNVPKDKGVLLFAAGDGNHSLAAAKGHWENIKKSIPDSEKSNHPSRFALVEVVNVHDDGLVFEPIHRVLFNVDYKHLLNSMAEQLCNCNAYYRFSDKKEDLNKEIDEIKKPSSSHLLPFITMDGYGVMVVDNPTCNLEVGTLQEFLDEYMKANSSVKVDYIHGEDVVTSLGSDEGNMGFYLPPMNKNDLFKTVILDGALPRKTFSMGEAEEKRYYLECRKI